MAAAATKHEFIKLSKRLQKNAALASKALHLEDQLVQAFGEHEVIKLDLGAQELGITIKVGLPGEGECTRTILDSLLEESPWLENLFRDMKTVLSIVRTYLKEVSKLFQQIQTWMRRSLPSFHMEVVPISIVEALTGEYSAKTLILHHAKKRVEIRPTGAWWLTTDGQVVLVGHDQEHALILSKKEGGWLYVQEYPEVVLRPLSEEFFIKLVQDCME